MTQRQQSKGICSYCQKELSKGGVTKHLAACPGRKEAISKAEAGKGTAEKLFHLRIEDAYRKEFWLDLEIRGSKTLNDLDSYLRFIWLECCGHMSEFMLGRGHFGDQIGKQRKIDAVFEPGIAMIHIYDMGTSSETRIKCVATRAGKPLTSKPIVLLARNLMPAEQCIECGQPATHLCMECIAEADTWGTLCEKHAENHPHTNYEEPFELVNSPRMGMCGYSGPAAPPY